MTSIRQYREAYKEKGSFEFPEYFEIYQKAVASVWRAQEVSFESDIRDWQNGTNDEREIIGGILRGFTQLECHVGDYWSKVPEWFPKHEVAAMARAFSLFEQIHAEAYNVLSDTLGLDEFEAFLGDPVARKKLEYFLGEKSEKVSLAIFSGGAEGVSLFSSFAVLLSLNLTGRYKGIAQIISWSALDEQEHSEGGIKLFNQLVKEEGLTDKEKEEIIQGFDSVIQNEYAFIDKIFDGRSVSTINPTDLKQYILFRANDRLQKMNIDYQYSCDRERSNRIHQWFAPIMAGATSSDFFAHTKDGSLYVSKPTQDFMSINLKTLDLELV